MADSKKPDTSEKSKKIEPKSKAKSDPVKLSRFGDKPKAEPAETPKNTSRPSPARAELLSKSRPKATKSPQPKKTGAGVSFPSAALMALIAALAGGAIGWMGPKIFDPANAAPAQAILENSTAIAALSSQSSDLQNTAQSLRSGLTSLEATTAAVPGLSGDVTQLQNAVAELVAKDIDAERAAAIDPLQTRLDALETLMTPEGEVDEDVVSEANVRASALLERITTLETTLEQLRAQPPVDMAPSVLTYSVPSKDAGPLGSQTAEEALENDVQFDFVANFPKQAMLSALTVQSRNREEPSWLRKLLSKHVQTDDVSDAQARDVIDQAFALTVKGDILAAVEKIETLNPTLRAAAHQWLIEAKKLR